MKIAQIVTTLDAWGGGPSVSVPKLADALAVLGNDVDILTTSSSKVSNSRTGASKIKVFESFCPHTLGISYGLSANLRNASYDIVNSHGLWQRPLHYARDYCRKNRVPFIISPRGMLSSWAWHHKLWKKKLAIRWIHPGALENASGWHATSEDEANDIRERGFTQPICVAPNGVDAPSQSQIDAAKAYWTETCPETAHRPTALFYSRFHRKKRVLELIDVWLKHAPHEWILLMVGISQEYSAEQLRDYVLRESGSGRIMIFDGTEAPPPYSVASLFMLPSHSENFGMVVAEALIHGLPVIVTDTMPWHKINDTDFGWCGPWELFADALASSLALGPDVLRDRGSQAKEWVSREYSWQKSASTLAAFYENLRLKKV
jgi:glycosyltransferase involved in cell wall biosynthesis